MKTSGAGIKLIGKREGQVLQMYRDSAGLPTIGVGHLLTKDELSSGKLWLGIEAIDWHKGLTMEQANALLEQDLRTAEAAVRNILVPLTQAQFDSLVSFAFNVGPTAFANSTLARRLNSGDYEAVPAELFRWVHAGGRVDPVLKRRRADEADQWKGALI